MIMVAKAHENQPLSMFDLRGLFGSSVFYFLVVLFSSISVLATSKQCTEKEVQNQCRFSGNFDSPDIIQNVCHMRPSSGGIKVMNTTEPDELLLQNWKSQAKVSMMFWTRVKKATAVLLFMASLVYLIIFLMSSNVTTVPASQGFLSGEQIPFSSGLSETVGSTIVQDEELLMDQSAVSSPSSVLNVNMEDTFDLSVRVRKEKGKRRKKKKRNSTPSSPLSPTKWTTTPKVIKTKNPFSHTLIEQSDTSECSKASSDKVMLKCKTDNIPIEQSDRSKCSKASSNEVHLKYKTDNQANSNNWAHHTPRERLCLVRKSAVKPVCSSSLLGPTYGIAPHAKAPGTKLVSQESDGRKVKMGVEKNNCTYDIWGDHLFGLPLACESKRVSSWPSYPVTDDSESFFVRGPHSFVKNCMLQSVVSDIGVNE